MIIQSLQYILVEKYELHDNKQTLNLLATSFQGGLYEKWGNDLLFRSKQESRKMLNHRQRLKAEVDSSPSLSIRQMQGAFLILSLGLGVAVLVFAGEALVYCHLHHGIRKRLTEY